MLTIQHSLITLLILDGDMEKFRSVIPYVLLPDAIRCYTGARQLSHFEVNSDNSDVSWMQFPLDLKTLNKENVHEVVKSHLADNIKSCCIGETTMIPTFLKYNKHLPLIYHTGVELHLTQDFEYDDFIRNHIDCSKKYDDIFTVNGNTFNGKDVRRIIAEVEEDGVAILEQWIYSKYHIGANQEWFKENVYNVICKVYSKELADNTYKYMKIRDDIEVAIHSQDWHSVKYNKTINAEDYIKMYHNVIRKSYELMCNLNFRTYKVVGKIKNGNNTVALDLLKCNGEVQRVSIDKLKNIMINNAQNVFILNAKISTDNKLLTSI